MPKENRPILKKRTKIASLAQSEVSIERYPETENLISSPKIEEKESDRPKTKNSKRKPFTCRMAVFDENEDPNKKTMYPKHLVYADGKDTQLEEIRAMHYWNRVKGTEVNFNLALRRESSKTYRDMSTQTEPEPTKGILVTETCTQTEYSSMLTQEIAIQTDSTESSEQSNHNSIKTAVSRITTRSSSKAKAASKIPAANSIAKSTIKEESSAINSATFIVPKQKMHAPINSKKPIRAALAQKLPDFELEHSDDDDDEENDLLLNTEVFKVLPASTPFQSYKNKNKGRRKTMKIESP